MLNPHAVRRQVENLKIVFPEILEDDEAWVATLESETDFNSLLTTLVERIDDTEALHRGTDERIEQLTARRARFANRISSLRDLICNLMQAAEQAKVELPLATLSLRAGRQKLVGDADPAKLHDDFCKISRDLDRTAIKEALKNGEDISGFALEDGKPSLTIRVR